MIMILKGKRTVAAIISIFVVKLMQHKDNTNQNLRLIQNKNNGTQVGKS